MFHRAQFPSAYDHDVRHFGSSLYVYSSLFLKLERRVLIILSTKTAKRPTLGIILVLEDVEYAGNDFSALMLTNVVATIVYIRCYN